MFAYKLKKAGLSVTAQKPITVFYDNEVQLVNYLVATRKPIGLVINFGEQKVEIKRKVKDLDPEDPVKKNL